MYDDHDPIARLMRAADPARTPADASLAPRHLAILDRITTEPPAKARARYRRFRPALLLTGIPLIAVLAIALVVMNLLPVNPAPAAALTPPPLQFAPLDKPAAEVLATAEANLTGRSESEVAERRAHTVGWYMDMQVGQSDTTVAIVPEDRWTEWDADLSGSIVVKAGRAYAAGGDPAAPLPNDVPEPGTLLFELTFDPGDFNAAAVDAPEPTDEAMLEFLSAYYGPLAPLEGGRLMWAIENAFDQWTLTNSQQAAILRLLARSSGVEVLGSTTDRVGREVVGLRANFSPNPRFDYTILISPETGRILGMESTTTVALSADFPAGSVASYVLWETSKQ